MATTIETTKAAQTKVNAAVMTFACPHCAAAPGEPCTGNSGPRKTMHPARYEAAAPKPPPPVKMDPADEMRFELSDMDLTIASDRAALVRSLRWLSRNLTEAADRLERDAADVPSSNGYVSSSSLANTIDIGAARLHGAMAHRARLARQLDRLFPAPKPVEAGKPAPIEGCVKCENESPTHDGEHVLAGQE